MDRVRGLRLLWLTCCVGLVLSCARHSRAPHPDPVLRVMTYNIQAGGGNLENIANVIRAANADLVALQEVDVHWHARSGFADQAAELAARLGMTVRFAPIYVLSASEPGAPAREYGVAVLSRYPVVEFTNHALTRLSTQSAGAPPSRMPGFLEAVVEVRGVRIRVFNTHLDYRGNPSVRRQQVIETLAVIGTAEMPVLMFGDLNAPPSAPELQPLFSRLRDAWPDSLGAGFTYPAVNPVRRIDYALVSSAFRVLDARVLDSQASDHRPLLVTLRFPVPRR